MNWSLVGSVIGIAVTYLAIKVVIILTRKLGSAERIDSTIKSLETECANGADKVTNYLSKKMEDRRNRKNEPPIITIR